MAVPVLDAENDDFMVIEDGAMKKKDVIVYSENRLDLKRMGHKDSMVKHEKRLEPGGIKDNDPIINHKMSLAKYETRDKDIIDDNHKKRLYLEGMTNTNVNSACLDDHSTHAHEDAPYLQSNQRNTKPSYMSNQRNTKPSYIVLLIVFVSVMTVLRKWIQNVLERKYSNSLNSCLEWTKELNNEECPDKTAMKQSIHSFVKTFHYISQGSFQTYMLYPQDYSKFIDERSTSSSSSTLKEAMQFEWCRLSSFANFPKINISVIRLSEAGFYYQGNEDEVVCFFCGLKHNHWKSTDNPKQIHVELSPNCPFVVKNMNTITSTSNDLNNNSFPTGRSAAPSGSSAAPTGSSAAPSGACGNQDDIEQVARGNARDTHNSSQDRIELGHVANSQLNDSSACNLCVTPENEETKTENLLTPKTENIEVISSLQSTTNQTESVSFSRNDTTGLIRVPQASFITGPVVTSQQLSSAASSALSSEPNNMGVCVDKPKYPKYAIRATRVSSFTNWPEYLAQKPEELALAGFFYTGTDDHCRCFFCGGGLRRWEAEDLPWTEHARWYPKCSFVMQCKGSKFIEDVLQGKDPERAVKQEEQSSAGVNGYSNNPVVQTILKLGIEPDLVKATYTTLKNSGIEDITATLLLETIYEIEDGTNRPTTSDMGVESGPTHVTKSTEQTKNIPVPEHKPTVDPSLELSIQSLENENRNLRDQQTCKICLDEPVAIVFLPCGHMAACVNCAPALRRCPICRAFIKGTVKAIMC